MHEAGRWHCPHCLKPISLPEGTRQHVLELLEALETARWCRAEAARMTGYSLRSIRYWINKLRAMGADIPDSHPTNRFKKRKSKK